MSDNSTKYVPKFKRGTCNPWIEGGVFASSDMARFMIDELFGGVG